MTAYKQALTRPRRWPWRQVGLKPYWGKPAVRNDREDRGNVGIIRSPVRASILPDHNRLRWGSAYLEDCQRRNVFESTVCPQETSRTVSQPVKDAL